MITENRFYNTGEAFIDINVISETWKYEQKLLDNLSLDAFRSFSLSKNDRETFIHSFQEPDPYTENVLRKSIENIKNSTTDDINQAFYLRGTKRINNTLEKESSFGLNAEYDFNLDLTEEDYGYKLNVDNMNIFTNKHGKDMDNLDGPV